jgi:hypothetical protein
MSHLSLQTQLDKFLQTCGITIKTTSFTPPSAIKELFRILIINQSTVLNVLMTPF